MASRGIWASRNIRWASGLIVAGFTVSALGGCAATGAPVPKPTKYTWDTSINDIAPVEVAGRVASVVPAHLDGRILLEVASKDPAVTIAVAIENATCAVGILEAHGGKFKAAVDAPATSDAILSAEQFSGERTLIGPTRSVSLSEGTLLLQLDCGTKGAFISLNAPRGTLAIAPTPVLPAAAQGPKTTGIAIIAPK